MKTPKNIKLIKASYVKDYIYRFEFSNGVVQDTNFRPMLRSGFLMEYLDVSKFKKMKCDEYGHGDIYWGKDWDMCFSIDQYYGVTKMIPHSKKEYTDYLKKVGLYKKEVELA